MKVTQILHIFDCPHCKLLWMVTNLVKVYEDGQTSNSVSHIALCSSYECRMEEDIWNSLTGNYSALHAVNPLSSRRTSNSFSKPRASLSPQSTVRSARVQFMEDLKRMSAVANASRKPQYLSSLPARSPYFVLTAFGGQNEPSRFDSSCLRSGNK